MTRWDSDNLNAAHTARELEQEWGGGEVNDLVRRLREFTVTGGGPTMLESEAADKIEQLERELSETMHWRDRYQSQLEESIKSMNEWSDMAAELTSQLAAEKALADQLRDKGERIAAHHVKGFYSQIDVDAWDLVLSDHRKARGL